MTTACTRSLVSLVPTALFAAGIASCRGDSTGAPSPASTTGPLALRQEADDPPRFSDWSEPVWLGPVVNSPARDWRPVLSTDGRRLYFHSNRDGGLGGFDIWVSRRAGTNCPWEPPKSLGPPLNTARDDGDPAFTPDMRVVFYSSDEGHGGAGRGDILVSRRADPNDDFAWEQPVNLGPHVNTDAHESNPAYVAAENGGTIYFERAAGGDPANSDIYKVLVTRDGQTRGPAVLVPELSAPAPINDNAPTVRADGRELIFWSNRPGGVGLADLWASTRPSVNDAWSAPRNLGRPVNSEFAELSATLSHDGRTLFFTAAQARGGLGLQDMWMSTRGPSVAADNEDSDDEETDDDAGDDRRGCDDAAHGGPHSLFTRGTRPHRVTRR
jgi:WD40-like Beta Propeller Repeat